MRDLCTIDELTVPEQKLLCAMAEKHSQSAYLAAFHDEERRLESFAARHVYSVAASFTRMSDFTRALAYFEKRQRKHEFYARCVITLEGFYREFCSRAGLTSP